MTFLLRLVLALAPLGLLQLFLHDDLAGQGGFREAAEVCSSTPAVRADGVCPAALGAVRNARAGLLSAASGGTPLPGTASTLGRRYPGSARVAFGGTVQVQNLVLPDLVTTERPRAGLERSGAVVAFRGGAAMGVFHGFSPRPTVGGILGLDLVGAASYLLLPTGAGFESGVPAWGVGARIGLLRESFTLPGITASVVRHTISRVELETDPTGETSFSTSGWSLRGIVGKDLYGVGLYAGVGQDRGSGRFDLRSPGSGGVAPPAYGSELVYRSGALPAQRHSLFAGGVYTLLVTQVSAELGWASGFDPVDAGGAGVVPGSGGMAFLSLLGRVTF